MKKWLLALLTVLLLCCCAMAEEEVFYVLEYDGNGGSCSISPQVIYPGETITLSDLWASREDYVFLGWATTPDATQPEYGKKASFTANQDTTLYAVWQECQDLGVIDPTKTYTVSYPVEKGFAYLHFEVPEDGYYYIHSLGQYWAGGTGTTWLAKTTDSYRQMTPEKVNNDFEFVVELSAGVKYRMMYYHNRDPLQIEFANDGFCVVQYDGNGGSCSIDPQTAKPGETITLSNLWASREDYVFLGWATTPDATQAEYGKKASFTANQNTILYAVWQECHDLGVIDPTKTYTVSYPVEKGFAYLHFEVPEDGYYYIHSLGQYWAGGSGTTWLAKTTDSYRQMTPDKVNDDFEFVVELTAGVKYRMMYYHNRDPLQIEFANDGFCLVRYDGNGGSCSIDPQTARPGETITLSNLWASREDYVFLGWATTPDATQPEYGKKASFTVNEDTTLYAVWAEARDVGVISGRQELTISYPAQKTFAYIRFTAGYTGYYHIHSTGDFLASGSGTTWLAPADDSYRRFSPDTSDDDFSFVVELTAGKNYRIMYYHAKDPLNIVFQPQYDGTRFESDLQLSGAVRSIGASAFEGTALTNVAIPSTVATVEANAFANCTRLESVLFSGAGTSIADTAFAGCEDVVIIAPVGSTAQDLAEKSGWDFLELK